MRFQGSRLGKRVRHIGDNRILVQDRYFRNDQWNGHEVRCILHRLSDGTMIRVVVTGSMGHDKIGCEGANLADDGFPNFQRRLQLAIGKTPDVITSPDDIACRFRFLAPALR